MNSSKSWLIGTIKLILPVAAMAGGAAGLIYAWRQLLKRSLPPSNGRVRLDGVFEAVEIIRDQWGVPHIFAQNEHDLFFAQGYVHAQDRMFQMDTQRRVGAGRISELAGPSGLATDRFSRYFGWIRAAEAQVLGVDVDTEAVLRAYSAGINAYIEQGRLPLEFSLLGYKPEPWQLFDTAAWGAVLAWGLSVNWETELIRTLLLEALGPEKAVDLTPLYNNDYRTILPDAKVGRRLATELLDAYRQALLSIPLGKIPDGSGIGSNNWVVNERHSASGRPILANDPHLPAIFPAFWYENHLVGGGFNVTGFTMPGVPGVIIGHNEHVAWGVTNGFPDVQDIYIERFREDNSSMYEVNGRWVEAEMVEEVIRVRGRKTVVETVRYTRHGPVFSDLLPQHGRDLALQWASYTRNNHMRAVLDMNRAADGKQLRESLRSWGFPSQNVVYADVHGDIGYKMPGLVPRRRKGSGLVPVPGWIDEYEWEGWISFEELPEYCNPPEGVLVTANNRVHGSAYPYLLTGEWLPDYRAKRILELIEAFTPLTLEVNGRIQSDTLSLQARRFLRLALPEMNEKEHFSPNVVYALRLLQYWDGDMRSNMVAPSLYWGWLVHFSQNVLEQVTGTALASELLRKSPPDGFPLDPFREIATELALNWLEFGSPDWVEDITHLLLPALEKTVEVLNQKLGPDQGNWQWGNLHQIKLQHPLARLPGLGRSWKPLTLPVDGDGYTVNQSEVEALFPPGPVKIIASCRLLIDVGEWDNSLAVLPGGQSAHPASPHYQDGLADWHNNQYHPMLYTRERIEAATESKIILHPISGGGPENEGFAEE